MSCQPCTSLRGIPNCGIQAILNRLYCSLCTFNRHKNRKYEDYRCAVRVLSSYSVDPRGGYAAFLGLRNNDPSKFAAIYIDTLRGEYDPNQDSYAEYLVAAVIFGDMNGVCRTMRLRSNVVAANAGELTGESPMDGTVARKIYRSQGGHQPNGTVIVPMGVNVPFAGNTPILVPGTPQDIFYGNENYGGVL